MGRFVPSCVPPVQLLWPPVGRGSKLAAEYFFPPLPAPFPLPLLSLALLGVYPRS